MAIYGVERAWSSVDKHGCHESGVLTHLTLVSSPLKDLQSNSVRITEVLLFAHGQNKAGVIMKCLESLVSGKTSTYSGMHSPKVLQFFSCVHFI